MQYVYQELELELELDCNMECKIQRNKIHSLRSSNYKQIVIG